jgi:hypothetical protein
MNTRVTDKSIYYELHDLLRDFTSREGEFSAVDPGIFPAPSAGLEKYLKVL